MRVFFGMETPLRGRSGGHAGTTPTVSFGWIVRGRLVSFGWIACEWLFGLCGIAWKNMMEVGRGGAYVPARVALRGAHSSFIFPWFGELLCEKSCARMRCTAFFMEWVAPKGEPTRGL